MTDGDLAPTEDAQALRATLRADLLAAMRSRRPEAVTALRTTLAALDDAEAVAPGLLTGAASEHLASTRTGVGSTEAARRVLPLAGVRALLCAQVAERLAEADRYDALGQHEAAGRLRREAEALEQYAAG